MPTTPDFFALCIHSPSTLASLGVHLFSLVKHDKTLGSFQFLLAGVSLFFGEPGGFFSISSTRFILAAMHLQTFISASFHSIHMVKLWILSLLLASALSLCFENSVPTTTDFVARCIQSPSTLASLGVHLFSLKKQDWMLGCFSFSLGGVSLILENLVFCFPSLLHFSY